MDIIAFTNKFHEIEINHGFYEMTDNNNLAYWDIVRPDIFNTIYHDLAQFKVSNTKDRKNNLIRATTKIISYLIGYIRYNLKLNFTKFNFIFFVASRNIHESGKAIDLISEDYLRCIGNESLLIESVSEMVKNNVFNTTIDYNLHFKEKIRSLFRKLTNNSKKSENHKVANILHEHFQVNINLDNEISKIIESHNTLVRHYTKLFKKTKPKAVFVVQNGIRKAIFQSANNLNITTIELQHGYIGYVHPSYSYPRSIKSGELITLPTHFFTFSEFWTEKINFPVRQIIPMGNSINSKEYTPVQREYDLTFIFAHIYTTIFESVIDDLLEKKYTGKICIKLHPNQANERVPLMEKYKKIKDIEIVYNEFTMREILLKSKCVLGVQSTSIYEALYFGSILVLILRNSNYKLHEDIFHHENVHLVDNADDIIGNVDLVVKSTKGFPIFQPFNNQSFNSFISSL